MYAADRFVTCKFIRNTQARFCNRKRCPDWITPTVQHLVQTHLNIIRKISRYLPVTDIAFEVNRFAFMHMENPEAIGVDFQNGPLKGYGDVKEAIRTQQHGKCLMCKKPIAHFHHIVPRSRGGSDTIQNLAGLCPECHTKVHKDTAFRKDFDEKKSGQLKKYGALSALNQAVPFICKKLLEEYGEEHVHFCRGLDTSLIRTALGFEKTKKDQMHEVDAYCVGLAALEVNEVETPAFDHTFQIRQFRRQDRSIIHHQTGRSYYQGKEKVAQNRKPGFEQKTTALSQWYEEQVRIHGEKEAEKLRSQLRVEKSCRHYNDMDRFLPGAVFLYEGKRYVLSGRITNGKYLRACGQGMKNFPAAECTFIRHNAGLVFI